MLSKLAQATLSLRGQLSAPLIESMQHALDCYNSSEYQAAKAIRQTVADGEIVIVEGVA